jgi:hypothetical protein
LLLDCPAENRRLDSINLEQLQDSLILWSRRHRLLNWLIGGMDSRLSKETRLLGLKLAEREMAGDPDALDFARNRLLSCPLPDCADLEYTIDLTHTLVHYYLGNWYLERCYGIYCDIYHARGFIEPISRILRKLVYFEYSSNTPPDEVYRVFVDQGVISKAVFTALKLISIARIEAPREYHPLELDPFSSDQKIGLCCPRLLDLLKA